VLRNRRSLALLAAGVVAVVTSCGGNGSNGNNTSSSPSPSAPPAIKFVGNSTCPTSGVTPYFTSGGKVYPAPVNSLPPVGQAIDEMPHTHVAPPAQVQYNHDPPTSGCHYSLGFGTAPLQPGAYNQVVPPMYWVHNLEHGYIVVLYNCPSSCATQFQQLRQWFHGLAPDPTYGYAKVLILPWTSMSVPFAAVSWDWYDPIPVFSISEVQRFYANHVGHGPEHSA
jgi:hypothetical protein